VLIINKNTANTQILTLSEKTTLTNAVYLFEVYNDQSLVKQYFIAANTSTNKYRYNQFVITENATQNLLNGVISLEVGEYKYNVYEQTSTTNLNPSLATNLIDSGKMRVVTTETATPEFTGTQETYTIYGG